MLRMRLQRATLCISSQLRSCASSYDDAADAVVQTMGKALKGESPSAEAVRERARAQPEGAPAIDEASMWTLRRLHEDSLRDTEALGGMLHPAYYRDPQRGYVPQYAPRNFAEGGHVDYHTGLSTREAAKAAQERELGHHSAERATRAARLEREATRVMSPEEYAAYVRDRAPSGVFDTAPRPTPGTKPSVAFSAAMNPYSREMHMPDRYRESARPSKGTHSGMTLRDSAVEHRTNEAAAALSRDEELMRQVHGLREQERSEHGRSQRGARRPMMSYDFDRYDAARRQGLFGQARFDPLVPPPSMTEAQASLRKNAATNDAAAVAAALRDNTVGASPTLGLGLTERLVGAKRLRAREADRAFERHRHDVLGIGRQGPLAQEAGPDRRTHRLHKNDERILDAAKFGQLAYSASQTTDVSSSYARNSTESGVGHLLSTSFDVARHAFMTGEGQPSIAERSTVHYGQPLSKQLDDFVRAKRGAKGERHTDFFKPFPTNDDMRLQQVYRDVEGFALLRTKPEFLEWELFCRYRAHHQQRRALALVHGLEPKVNETVAERDIRRARLDALCEATPFDASRLVVRSGEMQIGVEGLRNHFGAYFLPAPSTVEGLLKDPSMELTVIPGEDRREHLLSGRYLNRLLTTDAFLSRIRSAPPELIHQVPEPKINYLPESILKHFTEKEHRLYTQYIEGETAKQQQAWKKGREFRRWIAESNMCGQAVGSSTPVQVVDGTNTATGQTFILAASALVGPKGDPVNMKDGKGPRTCSADGGTFRVDPSSLRVANIARVRLDDGSQLVMEMNDFQSRPEVAPNADVNASLYHGLPAYHYNRANYVDTQDVIWEERTYAGDEGWVPARDDDGLRPGLPMLVRGTLDVGGAKIPGEWQRAVITDFKFQPFFNPNPRHVTVRTVGCGTALSVPLAHTMVWQQVRDGPNRTVGDETRRLTPTLKRYVDVADPNNERQKDRHFLDAYKARSTEDPFRSVKQITDLDRWTLHDESRSDSVRQLSITHRKDYVSMHYLPRHTPWDWIMAQESDAPMLSDQIRSNDTGYSLYFSGNRYWRWKRRAHGYIQNFGPEVRDLFQYIDQITPWKKAQKVRNLWEVRQHHPMPRFHRPEVAMHRNTAGLLPTHLWDVDKKTGKVKALKESVADYQTLEPYPSWVQL